MKILNNLLFNNDNKQVSFKQTPNKGGKFTPQYLVMHYTAATLGSSSIHWFTNKDARASAHLLIDRDGTITQFAPFNIITWHAGDSQWNGLSGMNNFSIGIELANGGKLAKTGNAWICRLDNKTVPDSDVIIARHKNEDVQNGWHTYTDIQLQTATEVAALLVKTYQLKDVLGHEDIAPHRKSDPGPAFPMSSFQSKVIGRKNDAPALFRTTAEVNIRSGAGTGFLALTPEPLPKNVDVLVLKREGNWSFAEVVNTVHGFNDLEGWIFSKFLVQQ